MHYFDKKYLQTEALPEWRGYLTHLGTKESIDFLKYLCVHGAVAGEYANQVESLDTLISRIGSSRPLDRQIVEALTRCQTKRFYNPLAGIEGGKRKTRRRPSKRRKTRRRASR